MQRLFTILVASFVFVCLDAQEKYSVDNNVVYREGCAECILDISYRKGLEDRPVVIWFHGGGLTSGKKYTPKEFLAEDYVIVSVGYRLYPSASVSEILDDAAKATAWVVKNIASYGGSSDRIFLSGHSAGGYLVSMIALDKHYLAKYDVDPDSFASVIPLSGQMMTHFTEKAARGIPKMQPVVDEMAPLFHIRPDSAPFVLVTGDREKEMICRYEENVLFCALMRHVGHPSVVLYEEEGFTHSGMRVPGYAIIMSTIKGR